MARTRTSGLRKRREKKIEEMAEIDPILIEKDKVIDLQMNEIRRLNHDLELLRKEIEKKASIGTQISPNANLIFCIFQ